MAVGKMRAVVTFLQNVPTAKGAGFADNYTTLLNTRGELVDLSDFRTLGFGEIDDGSTKKLICRFQTAIANSLRSDTKIVIDTITYTMQGRPKLIDQKKHLYEFRIQCQQL